MILITSVVQVNNVMSHDRVFFCFHQGCLDNVGSWLFTNYAIILGICLGVAVIEVCCMSSGQREQYAFVLLRNGGVFIINEGIFRLHCAMKCNMTTFCWTDYTFPFWSQCSVFFSTLQLLGMILSMGLCKSVHQEEYTKVPKYWGGNMDTHTQMYSVLSYLLGTTDLPLFLQYIQCFQKRNFRVVFSHEISLVSNTIPCDI